MSPPMKVYGKPTPLQSKSNTNQNKKHPLNSTVKRRSASLTDTSIFSSSSPYNKVKPITSSNKRKQSAPVILAQPIDEKLSTPSPQTEDEILLSQSDELFREVLSLCQENGIEESLRKEFSAMGIDMDHFETVHSSASSHFAGAGDAGLDLTPIGGGEEGIISVPSMSLYNSVSSTPRIDQNAEITQHSPPILDAQNENPSATDSVKGTPMPSPELLPSSVASPPIVFSPVSPEYDYTKVFGILRMIEEEEAKGSEIVSAFGELMKEKQAMARVNSPTTTGQSRRFHGTLKISPTPPSSDIGIEKLFNENNSAEFELELDQFPGSKNPSTLPPSSIFSSPRQREEDCNEFDRLTSVSQLGDPMPSHQSNPPLNSSRSRFSEILEPLNEKTKKLLSFLDEVEEVDRETLFNLKFESGPRSPLPAASQRSRSLMSRKGGRVNSAAAKIQTNHSTTNNTAKPSSAQTMDTLIRRGSAELAREIIMLERQVEDSAHNINVLEETLLSQRELNIRNMKNSERDMKKRLKIQQEEFDLAFSRQQAFLDQVIGEKRALQEKCEKVLKDCKDNEQKYQQKIKSIQETHLEEIKRLRKLQENAEKSKKQKWVGQKTQEIRDMTVKGLEPEVQRIIQRHQQEMAETRAFYADELQEVEDRYARKQTHQLQELRENFQREKDEACKRERDMFQKRLETELQRQAEEFETQKRRLLDEVKKEKDRIACEEGKIREYSQENIRKVQIKSEVELENLRQEYDTKVSNLEKRHEKEIQSLRDNFESQRENWMSNFNKKNEQILQDREIRLAESINQEKEKEIREREKKLKEEYERIRKEEESIQEARIKRLQEKFQSELQDLESSEKELKQKFSSVKSEILAKEEEIFSLRTTFGLKEKENRDLIEANMRMLEERVNLTSIIRREFTSQIETLEEDCRGVKAAVVELKAKHRLDLESHGHELDKLRNEKETEIEQIGIRVKQALVRKEETINELSKQLEKAHIRINHLDVLLEQQRKDFVQSMTSTCTTGGIERRNEHKRK